MDLAATALDVLKEFKEFHCRTLAELQALRALSLAIANELPSESRDSVVQALVTTRLEGATPCLDAAFKRQIEDLAAAIRGSESLGGSSRS